MIWVHSSPKAARDAAARAARIEAGLAAIETVQARLSSPKSRLKTLVAAEAAATTALDQAGATRWVAFTLTQTTEQVYRQERRGRPGSQTRYRRTEKPVFTITATVRADTVAYDAVTDGCYPLTTNDQTMTPAQVLAAYRYQPNLERRHHILKGPQQVAPVFLENAHRIEALLLCHFLALLTEALIEREIRTSMHNEQIAGIPLYPELRNCTRAQRRTRPGDLQPRRTPPPHPRRGGRTDLRTRTHPVTAQGPRPAARPRHRLHLDPTLLRWGAKSITRSAERQI